ncbi:MAG: DUF975 family protein [Chitinispirillaceae bacterium]|nr:DUF975 family protein [Chitinispirillaceae bacterium]
MFTSNRDLMTRARASLNGKWGIAIGISMVYFIISAIAGSPKYLKIIGLIINGPLTVGYYIVFLSLIRKEEVRFSQLFEGFASFLNALGAYLLIIVFVVLWSLLLIIPGIMAAFSYSMTLFLIADNQEMDAFKAIKASKEMMYGNRWKLCCFGCRYTGWFILGIITCGIGFIWIFPYMIAGFAHFYQDLLDNPAKAMEQTIAAS